MALDAGVSTLCLSLLWFGANPANVIGSGSSIRPASLRVLPSLFEIHEVLTSIDRYNFTIEGHKLTVIEADGIETEPHEVDTLQIFAGS